MAIFLNRGAKYFILISNFVRHVYRTADSHVHLCQHNFVTGNSIAWDSQTASVCESEQDGLKGAITTELVAVSVCFDCISRCSACMLPSANTVWKQRIHNIS